MSKSLMDIIYHSGDRKSKYLPCLSESWFQRVWSPTWCSLLDRQRYDHVSMDAWQASLICRNQAGSACGGFIKTKKRVARDPLFCTSVKGWAIQNSNL